MFLQLITFIISLTLPDKTNIIILVKAKDSRYFNSGQGQRLPFAHKCQIYIFWWLGSFVQGADGQHFPMCGVFPFWTRIQQVMHIGYVKVLMGFDNHATSVIDEYIYIYIYLVMFFL